MDAATRLENHWLACMASAGGGGQVSRAPGALVAVNPRVDAMYLNFLTLRFAQPETLEATLEAGCALLAARSRSPLLFLAPPAGDVEALGEALRGLGWRRQSTQAVLTRLLPCPAEPPPDIIVREIGSGDLSAWGEVLVRAYEVVPSAGQSIRAGWCALMESPGEGARARFYLAGPRGAPAGTGLLWMQGSLAGLYCGAVLPAYRRQGVETATLLRRMADAARDGAQMAVLQTEPNSAVEHVCLDRLGFVQAYSRELWLPPGRSPLIAKFSPTT